MPSASPPRVIVLSEIPEKRKKIKVTKIESGIAINMIIVLLTFLMKIIITNTARRAPIAPSLINPEIESLM